MAINRTLQKAYREGFARQNRLNKIQPIILPNNYAVEPVDNIFEPKTFDDYIGQEKAKDLAQIMAEAATKEHRKIPSILISGSYGLGKTTLGKLILKGASYREMTGTVVDTNTDLKGYVLIDEIHNVKPEICDNINQHIDSGRTVIIGCTTNPGILPAPFRSRFRSINLTPYTVDDLTKIMYNVLDRKGSITARYDLLTQIAERSRSTPRIALQYLSFTLDLMSVRDEYVLTQTTLNDSFDKLGVDNLGLLEIDHRYLEALPDDRPVGLQYLSAVLQTDKDTIEQEIEPYLLQMKLIDRNSRGRFRIASLEQELQDSLDAIFKEI